MPKGRSKGKGSVVDKIVATGRALLSGSRADVTSAVGENVSVVVRLEALAADSRAAAADFQKHKPTLERIREQSDELAKAWSGGWLGYHSRVYKSDLAPKRPGDYFDTEWGTQGAFSNETRGDWAEFDFRTLRDGVFERAGIENVDAIQQDAIAVALRFENIKREAHAILSAAARADGGTFLADVAKELDGLASHLTARDYVTAQIGGKQFRTRDMRAFNEGAQAPPHVDADARAVELLSYQQSCEMLAACIERAVTYMRTTQTGSERATGVDDSREDAAITRVLRVIDRFHAVRAQLRRRHARRSTLEVEDEYDVQDLLHALLKVDFDDIRGEEWTPSYAGRSSRADLVLKGKGIFIEVKITADGRAEKQIGDELSVDFAHYRGHPECKTLVCFVYDPEFRIANHQGFQDDLEDLTTSETRMIVRVRPSP